MVRIAISTARHEIVRISTTRSVGLGQMIVTRRVYYTISPFVGEARKHSTAGDAVTDILVVHPGTGSRDALHWNMLHDPDRCLQNV